MGTRINQHEPSRHLFLGICDAAEALANSQDNETFLEKLFLLDKQFHPMGLSFGYMIPAEDDLKVDLNGNYVYDAKFFLPMHLLHSVTLIHQLYKDLLSACASYIRRKFGESDVRTEIQRYAPLGLKIGQKTKETVYAAVAQIRQYFLKIHVLI